MKIHKYPKITAAIQQEKGRAGIYLFYEINEPKQKYFWFQLSGIKEEIVTIISKKLEG